MARHWVEQRISFSCTWERKNPITNAVLGNSIRNGLSGTVDCRHDLRFYQTPIRWLRSLSAILPLFWRHGIANFPAFAAKTWEMLLWRHEIDDVFPRNWANALQNLQFFHHFKIEFDIFSLNLTGESDFLILFLSTQNKLSISSF